MKKFPLLFVCLMIMTNAFSAPGHFVLKGKIEGTTSDKVVLSYYTCLNNKWAFLNDTAIIQKGYFQFKGKLQEPVQAQLKIDKIGLTIYIEPTKMEMVIPQDDPSNFNFKGSKTQDDEKELDSKTQYLFIQYAKLGNHIQNIFHQLNSISEDNSNYKRLIIEKETIASKRDSVYKLISKIDVDFYRLNPNSYYPILSNKFLMELSQKYIQLDIGRVLFNNMSVNVRNSLMGKETNKYITIHENIQVGQVAPDFNTPDMNGKLVSLFNYRGSNYVLLDFWASWCAPCIKGLPQMRELYTKYHNKGLQIIGISCDRSKKDWIAAIEKHQITIWPEVSVVQDLEKASQGYNSDEDIRSKYPIDGIPKYLLIDKTGKIIGKWDSYSEQNEQEQDKMMADIFGK